MAENRMYEIEGARLKFKNFSGEARKYNAEGDRNFNVVIDHEFADQLKNDGFSIRERVIDEEYDEVEYLLKVKVSYRIRPPKIVVVSRTGKRNFTENMIDELDYSEITEADLVFRGVPWPERVGRSGMTAYLDEMYVVLRERRFEEKYADVPDLQ